MRLSVFTGGWTRVAAEHVVVGAGLEKQEVLGALKGLVDKSLVITLEQPTSVRYRMLETVREYAHELLVKEGEEGQSQKRHRNWFLQFAQDAARELKGPRQTEWLDRLEAEHDNIRKILRFSVDDVDSEVGLQLCAALGRFWYKHCHFAEGIGHFSVALKRGSCDNRTPARAEALAGLSALVFAQGDYKMARAQVRESLKIWRKLGNRKGIASSLNSLGRLAWAQGDCVKARARHEKSLEIWREHVDQDGIAVSLHFLALVARAQGDYANAQALQEEGLVIDRELGDQIGIAWSLNNLGNIAFDQGE